MRTVHTSSRRNVHPPCRVSVRSIKQENEQFGVHDQLSRCTEQAGTCVLRAVKPLFGVPEFLTACKVAIGTKCTNWTKGFMLI